MQWKLHVYHLNFINIGKHIKAELRLQALTRLTNGRNSGKKGPIMTPLKYDGHHVMKTVLTVWWKSFESWRRSCDHKIWRNLRAVTLAKRPSNHDPNRIWYTSCGDNIWRKSLKNEAVIWWQEFLMRKWLELAKGHIGNKQLSVTSRTIPGWFDQNPMKTTREV